MKSTRAHRITASTLFPFLAFYMLTGSCASIQKKSVNLTPYFDNEPKFLEYGNELARNIYDTIMANIENDNIGGEKEDPDVLTLKLNGGIYVIVYQPGFKYAKGALFVINEEGKCLYGNTCVGCEDKNISPGAQSLLEVILTDVNNALSNN